MSSAHQDPAALSYYQTSPVRGQLEPYESQSRQGWRYLQCTDTPNELKVRRVLPARNENIPLIFYARSCCPQRPRICTANFSSTKNRSWKGVDVLIGIVSSTYGI
jgi:hypothetical protein